MLQDEAAVAAVRDKGKEGGGDGRGDVEALGFGEGDEGGDGAEVDEGAAALLNLRVVIKGVGLKEEGEYKGRRVGVGMNYTTVVLM